MHDHYLKCNYYAHTYSSASSCTSEEVIFPLVKLLLLRSGIVFRLYCTSGDGVILGQSLLIGLHVQLLVQFEIARVDSTNSHSNPVQSNSD